MYCRNCGRKLTRKDFFCNGCGKRLDDNITINNVVKDKIVIYNNKSRIMAVILAILFGNLGVHNFYLGYIGKGIIQLLLTLVGWIFIIGPIVASCWSFIEGVLLLIDHNKTDAKGNKLIN